MCVLNNKFLHFHVFFLWKKTGLEKSKIKKYNRIHMTAWPKCTFSKVFLADQRNVSVKFSDRMGLFLEDLSFNKHLVYVFQRLNIESDDWVDDASNKTNQQTYIHAQSSCITLISYNH
jgi:hypothetical protein